MIDQTEVIKVKPWGKGQGDFVEINAEDFDEKLHTKTGEPKAKPRKKAATEG